MIHSFNNVQAPGLGLPQTVIPTHPTGGLAARDFSSPSWRHEVSSYSKLLLGETLKTVLLMPISIPLMPLFFTPVPDTGLTPVGDAIGYAGRYLLNSAMVFGYSLASPFIAAQEILHYGATQMPGTEGALDILNSPETSAAHKGRLTSRLFQKDYAFMNESQKRRLWESVLNRSKQPDLRLSYAVEVFSHRRELKEQFPDLLEAFKELYPGYRNHPEF